jgi:hypothetical protein
MVVGGVDKKAVLAIGANPVVTPITNNRRNEASMRVVDVVVVMMQVKTLKGK